MTLALERGGDAFAYLRELVRSRSGLDLSDEKRYLVEARCSPVARRAGLADLDALVRALRSGLQPALERAVVDAMTTNETSFFRDRAHFEALAEVILPERIEANRTSRHLAIWSAGCSTGQEPYSVAMLLEARFPLLASWRVDLLATDLSETALERARAARYSAFEVDRGLSIEHRAAWCTPDSAGYLLDERLRSRVRFAPLNLARPWPQLPPQDVILLRNVLIYFDAATRRRVLRAVRSQLRLRGYLLLGAAEVSREPAPGLRAVPVNGATVYRRDA